MPDVGLTHLALTITDPGATVSFYQKYAGLRVVHRRAQSGSKGEVFWMSDGMRPFVLVFVQVEAVDKPLLPFSHVGVACESLEQFHSLCAAADQERRLLDGPHDSGPPVGHWAFIRDPDGHTLELSFGQEVAVTVKDAE